MKNLFEFEWCKSTLIYIRLCKDRKYDGLTFANIQKPGLFDTSIKYVSMYLVVCKTLTYSDRCFQCHFGLFNWNYQIYYRKALTCVFKNNVESVCHKVWVGFRNIYIYIFFPENQDRKTSKLKQNKQTINTIPMLVWDGSLNKHLFSFSRNQRLNNVFPRRRHQNSIFDTWMSFLTFWVAWMVCKINKSTGSVDVYGASYCCFMYILYLTFCNF